MISISHGELAAFFVYTVAFWGLLWFFESLHFHILEQHGSVPLYLSFFWSSSFPLVFFWGFSFLSLTIVANQSWRGSDAGTRRSRLSFCVEG
ncbi:uncharacterized protein BDW47DRAFT_109834 [Aspergillus candidus]|uniref:Uncharacterized protein n=1 Tax=Aspergillus candidus TaxID=41067 RepID=A0A2I2F565_ASPCN|nr:hypothetical protein BDW47DRAFT_109834 [Aspergillus candidus]PLB35790.1 hypothetical protein BDW47DRAFT_109834 [Aspergillus candidus]